MCFVGVCVQEHDCKLTRDIVELVDREADLLVRDVPEHALEGAHAYKKCAFAHAELFRYEFTKGHTLINIQVYARE